MLQVTMPSRGFAPTRAAQAVRDSGLPELLLERARGPFGHTEIGILTLETLAHAVDVSLASSQAVRGLLLERLSQEGAFTLPTLANEHRQLIASVQLVVLADTLTRHLSARISLPAITGELDLDGLPELLAAEHDPALVATRILKLAMAYARLKSRQADEGEDPSAALAACVASFLGLARRTILLFSKQSAMRPLLAALSQIDLEIAGFPYDGLEVRALQAESVGLLDVSPADIVGNEEYLSAGRRLARDVAGYDFDLQKNPKRVNPILFGLGRPGCGKTVTAHAVANDFLSFCRERDIPAKFIIIQRTDWASSYQNASAMNLVRIFREEVHGYDGVCGVYWPDIDTAFASRASGSLRSEEKQNLGAVFGIFDGTLLPKDGKWFMLCDANTLHMDEATVSRIAQNPMTVHGPQTPGDYVQMMRDLMLRDVSSFLALDEDAWGRVGARVQALGLSGRNIDAVCGNVRAHIQDFEYPDAYFRASVSERAEILRELSHTAHEADLMRFIDDWAAFQREAESQAEEERFQSEVDTIVRRLNASKEAAHRALQNHEDS